MTKRQREIIADNLQAFLANYGEIRIETADYGPGFYVFYPTNAATSYIQFCYNIDYLNGWLYGAVQAIHQLAPAKKRDGIPAEMDEYNNPQPVTIPKAAHKTSTPKGV